MDGDNAGIYDSGFLLSEFSVRTAYTNSYLGYVRKLHPAAGWLPILLYFFPNLTGDNSHFLHALLAGFAISIRNLGKLVGVITNVLPFSMILLAPFS